MKEYEIALVIIVKQRGVDASDAEDHIIANMQLKRGQSFNSPHPLNGAEEAGAAMLVVGPTVVMTKLTQ